jgi:hypothetical protein
MDEVRVVSLPRRAADILRDHQVHAGECRHALLANGTWERPRSENTVYAAVRA